MNVLFVGGPRDGERGEWDEKHSSLYVKHSHGKNYVMVQDDKSDVYRTVRYDLQWFSSGSDGKLMVAVASDVTDVLGDLIKGYKTTPQLNNTARARIIEAARKEWHNGSVTFYEVVNHVIDDARNAR